MRILFVSQISSVHAAKWVKTAQEAGIKSDFFQAVASPSAINSEFSGYRGRVYLPFPFQGPEVSQKSLFENQADLEKAVAARSASSEYLDFFVRTVRRCRPDAIHLLGLCINFENLSELLVSARAILGRDMPKLIYSSWGADLDYFPRLNPEVLPAIRAFLALVDVYFAECSRDLQLARDYGFDGRFAGFFPANGGFDSGGVLKLGGAEFRSRKCLALKGRDISDGDPVGRAAEIFRALRICAAEISEFQIHVFQASQGKLIPEMAESLRRDLGLNVIVEPRLTDFQLYSILSESRLFLSMTVNDGLPLMLVEAMAMGALPIHSDLSSVRDYIEPGKNGYLVDPQDSQELARIIGQAAKDESTFEAARLHNATLVKETLSRVVVREKIKSAYEAVQPKRSLRRFWDRLKDF